MAAVLWIPPSAQDWANLAWIQLSPNLYSCDPYLSFSDIREMLNISAPAIKFLFKVEVFENVNEWNQWKWFYLLNTDVATCLNMLINNLKYFLVIYISGYLYFQILLHMFLKRLLKCCQKTKILTRLNNKLILTSMFLAVAVF